MKKGIILILVISLFLAVLSPVPVQAQSQLTIRESSALAEFPASLSFSLSASSGVNITEARLHYTVDQESFAAVTSEVYVEFVPSPTIDIQYSLDMRRTGGLPSGSSVEFWWTVQDTGGSTVETDPAIVRFEDTRYSWLSLTEGQVTMYWYQGEATFAQELMAAAQAALARLASDTGAAPEKPVRLYIYASSRDLQGAMVFPQEWTGGVAYTRFGAMAIGIAPGNLEWGKKAIVHELTHLVIHQITLNAYNELPTWLNEGLAMYTEGRLDPEFTASISKATAEDGLISVRSLSSPFSALTQESILSYAQSYSLVEFLISKYGQPKMLELLNTFKQGSSYDGALERVYGFDSDGLNNLWQDYAAELYRPAEVEEEAVMSPMLIVIIAVLAAGLLLAIGFVAVRRARRRAG